jgi:aurora kinase
VHVSICCPAAMLRSGPWKIEDFEMHKQLYKGKASLLYKATCRFSSLPVALKLYRKSRLSALNWYQVCELRSICYILRVAYTTMFDRGSH